MMTLPLMVLIAAHLVPPTATDYKQPQLAASKDLVAAVFGSANVIYFTSSRDQGNTFSEPRKVAEVPGLNLGKHRGPRVVFTPAAIVVSAINGADILTWRSTDQGKTWIPGANINDSAKSAREGLHAMAAAPDGRIFAAWLDLRHLVPGKPGTELYGAYSTDNGATWSKNAPVYLSPDGSICQCCHPTVAFTAGGELEVMWRNALGGSRDMYLVSSRDGGKSFGTPEKLGGGTWPLNACPMDGGGMAITPQGKLMTTWRRGTDIYIAPAGGVETLLQEGRDPAIAANSNGVYIAWTSSNGVLARVPGKTEPVTLDGEGAFIQLIAVPGGPVLAAWERKGIIQFHTLP
jgi:photosystem II stability/assembly factor-like uncharacterized protein